MHSLMAEGRRKYAKSQCPPKEEAPFLHGMRIMPGE